MTKSTVLQSKMEIEKISRGLLRVKLNSGRGFFKIGQSRREDKTNLLCLEINTLKSFEIGNTCDTCHFWFHCLKAPAVFSQKKVVNIPKTIQIPRPIDEEMLWELSPLFELFEKGDYAVFETEVNLSGPFRDNDEGSYFRNSEFLELWDLESPEEAGLLSGWEHYESARPRVFRHESPYPAEKQFSFIIPLVPVSKRKDEFVKVYESMIRNGDRPKVLLLGFYQRPVPAIVAKGEAKSMHSFFGGFVLDGHHKLAAYRRAGVPARFLTILSYKASKYALLPDEETGKTQRERLDERLGALAL